MFGKKFVISVLAVCFSAVCVAEPAKQAVKKVNAGDMLHWTVGLLVVLAIFFFCVWGIRKLNGITFGANGKMRVIGGLSLGMREKVVLLQVGNKQLILGVTPGRIDTLHVLEGDDCIGRENVPFSPMDNGFAQKLMQAMKGRHDE